MNSLWRRFGHIPARLVGIAGNAVLLVMLALDCVLGALGLAGRLESPPHYGLVLLFNILVLLCLVLPFYIMWEKAHEAVARSARERMRDERIAFVTRGATAAHQQRPALALATAWRGWCDIGHVRDRHYTLHLTACRLVDASRGLYEIEGHGLHSHGSFALEGHACRDVRDGERAVRLAWTQTPTVRLPVKEPDAVYGKDTPVVHEYRGILSDGDEGAVIEGEWRLCHALGNGGDDAEAGATCSGAFVLTPAGR